MGAGCRPAIGSPVPGWGFTHPLQIRRQTDGPGAQSGSHVATSRSLLQNCSGRTCSWADTGPPTALPSPFQAPAAQPSAVHLTISLPARSWTGSLPAVAPASAYGDRCWARGSHVVPPSCASRCGRCHTLSPRCPCRSLHLTTQEEAESSPCDLMVLGGCSRLTRGTNFSQTLFTV